MREAKIDQLLALLEELVLDGNPSWTEARDAILSRASERGKIAISEFSSWWEDLE